jgi:hypothetical protein
VVVTLAPFEGSAEDHVLAGAVRPYANWFTTLLAAVWGTHVNAPVTGVEFHARPWQEFIAAFRFNSLAAAMVIVCLLLIYGLRRPPGGSS